MNILYQYFSGGGGALSNFIQLLTALSIKYPDDKYYILCSESSQLQSLKKLNNVKIISYGGRFPKEVSRLILGWYDLIRIAKKNKVDILWSLNLGAYTKSNIPQILSVNNPHQVYPWEVTKYHPDNGLTVAAMRWFFRKSLKASDAVIVQTGIMEQYIKKIKYSPHELYIVPKSVENMNDFDFERIPDDIKKIIKSGLGKNAYTFLYVSTYSPHKNHKTLIDVIQLLSNRGIKVRLILTLTVVELEKYYGKKVKNLIDDGYIIPVGWIQKKYLFSLYDNCDACLMPSVLESLSSAHLEAMRWGKPQIVADLPYSRDLCGNAAIYVSAENPDAWVNKISELMSDSELRSRLINNGFEQIKKFPETWKDMAGMVHDIFEQIILNHKKNNEIKKSILNI
ncbi:MAG: glycosyltransferase family 4 protein [Eubacteriaceae bacterium]|nr:glycosyltransferase family 4 protein [Eubacteriaceae bacterium]